MISRNVSKHEITVSLCRAKLNTIKDIVSQALTDNKISHEEFLLIKSEVDKYHEMRNSIRRKYQKHSSRPQGQQPDMEIINNEIRADIIKNLLNQGEGKPSYIVTVSQLSWVRRLMSHIQMTCHLHTTPILSLVVCLKQAGSCLTAFCPWPVS